MLVDTDVLIWALRGSHKAARKIDTLERRALSVVSWMELIRGARDQADLRATRQFLRDLGFGILPLTENISHRAVVYMEEYSLRMGLGLADALIAATAAEHGEDLLSGNTKHYKPIAEIKLVRFTP